MKAQFYIFLVCCLFPILLAAQSGSTCGVAPDPASIQWMNQQREAIQRFNADPSAHNRLREAKKVPLRFVAFNTGKTSGLNANAVNQALANLNQAFQALGLEFFSCQTPVNVLNSPFAEYTRIEEAALWREFKTTEVISIFCVESIDFGAVSGYTYLPGDDHPDAIFIALDQLNSTTLPHEMGHFFGLYHTHGKSNCETLTDELVNDPDCAGTGDEVCDTPADPNLLGVGCNNNFVNPITCAYTGMARDKNGNLYRPDPSNLMSYANNKCRKNFSPGQIERMRYFLNFRVYPTHCPTETCIAPYLSSFDSTYTSIELGWATLAQDSLYQIRYRIPGDSNWVTIHTYTNKWSLKGLKPCTKIEVQIRRNCSGSFSSWSTPRSYSTMGCSGSYCANLGNGNNVWINKINIGNWTKNSGDNDGYLLTPGSGLLLNADSTYTIGLEPGGAIRVRDTLFWQVWVDKNRDRDFNDPGEQVYRGKSMLRNLHSAKFRTPADLWDGESWMRVSLSLNKFVEVCNAGGNTLETEDYIINIRSSKSCASPSATHIAIKQIKHTSVDVQAIGLEAYTYQWELRLGTGEWVRNILGGSVDTLRIPFLTAQTRYQLRLKILCRNGYTSEFSDPVFFTTLTAPCNAINVQTLRVQNLLSNSATLICGRLSSAAFYQFSYRPVGSSTWTESAIQDTSVLQINGLSGNTAYEFRVLLYCTKDLSSVSPYSEVKSFVTPRETCTTPAAGPIKVSISTDNVLSLRYDTVYTYQQLFWRYRRTNAFNWVTVPATDSITRVTVEGEGTKYEVMVQGLCSNGEKSEWSKGKLVTTGCSAPKPSDIKVQRLDFRSVEINYLGSNLDLVIRFKPLGASEWAERYLSSSTAVIDFLSPSTTYLFQLKRACGFTLYSEYSDTLQFTTAAFPCDLPVASSLKASSISTNSAIISCDDVPNIFPYYFFYRIKGAPFWTPLNSAKTPRAILNNLKANTVYEFKVGIGCRYANELISSPTSTAAEFKTLKGICQPASTFDLFPKYLGKRIMRVKCALEAKAYAWRYRAAGAKVWQDSAQIDSTTLILTQLDYPAQYEIQVKLLCSSDEWSVWSSTLVFSTPFIPCVAPDEAKISAIRLSDSTWRFAFDGVPYIAKQWYYRLKNAAGWITLSDSLNQAGFEFLPGEAYEIALQGTCENLGVSTWSNSRFVVAPCPGISSAQVKIDSLEANFARIRCSVPENLEWRYKPSNKSSWTGFTTAANSPALFKRLSSNTVYQYQLRRVCQTTLSEYSDTLEFTTAPLPPGVLPCALNSEQINVSDEAAGVVRVSSLVPAKEYFWAYRKKGLAKWEFETSGKDSTRVFTGLSPVTNYEFAVKIVCPYGDTSDWALVSHYPVCQALNRRDISYRTGRLFEGYFKCTNPNFTAFEWRYRLLHPSNAMEWSFDSSAVGEEILLNNLFEPVYEFQVRGRCKISGKWSNWSESVNYTAIQCVLPTQLYLFPSPLNDTTTQVYAGNTSETWYSKKFSWIYRELSDENGWSAPLTTTDPVVQVKGLISGVWYEMRVTVFCNGGYFDSFTQSQVFKAPLVCFTPDTKHISIDRITASTARLQFDYAADAPYEFQYRPKGSTKNYSIVKSPGTSLPINLLELEPGTEYEVMARAVCKQDTQWSKPIYFTTKACHIPYAGEIVLQSITANSAKAKLEFQAFAHDLKGLDYVWKYKLKRAKNWQVLAGNNTSELRLNSLLKDSIYQLQAVVKCPNYLQDSIRFSTSFTTIVDECAQMPAEGWIKGTYDPTYGNYYMDCTLPPGYYFDFRYWVSDERGIQLYDPVQYTVQCQYQTGGASMAEGQTLFLQTRLRCPSGNLGPWSDTFQLTRKKKLWDTPTELTANSPQGNKHPGVGFSLKPNPTPGRFSIQNSVELSGPGTLSIYGSDGRQVLHRSLENISGAWLDIDLSEHPAGLYFVHLVAGKVGYTEKILLQKP